MSDSRPRHGAGLRAATLIAAGALAFVGVGRVAADQTATISDGGYLPQVITIHAGESISWINNGASGQSVTADDGTFDSGPIDHGRQYAVTLTELGTFNIHSALGGFRGQIVVLGIDVTNAPPVTRAPTPVPIGGEDQRDQGSPSPLLILVIAVGVAVLAAAAFAVSRRPR
jgi:plastocyanin